MALPEELTIDDLVTAFVERDKHKDYSYYEQKLKLMQILFECDLERGKKEVESRKRKVPEITGEERYEINGKLTIHLLEECIRMINLIKTPFDRSGWLEGLPPKIDRDLSKQ